MSRIATPCCRELKRIVFAATSLEFLRQFCDRGQDGGLKHAVRITPLGRAPGLLEAEALPDKPDGLPYMVRQRLIIWIADANAG
jgi:hypothetical protein